MNHCNYELPTFEKLSPVSSQLVLITTYRMLPNNVTNLEPPQVLNVGQWGKPQNVAPKISHLQ